MTSSACLPSMPEARRRRSTAVRTLVALLSVALLALLAFSAAPAAARVTNVPPAEVGLQPRISNFDYVGLVKVDEELHVLENPAPESFSNPEGHPVVHGSQVFVVYWDPQDYYHGDWQHLIDGFVRGMGVESGSLENVFALEAQYIVPLTGNQIGCIYTPDLYTCQPSKVGNKTIHRAVKHQF